MFQEGTMPMQNGNEQQQAPITAPEFGAAQKEELLALQKEQTRSTEWSEEKRLRLLELTRMQEAENANGRLTDREREEYLALSRRSSGNGDPFSPEEVKRFSELQQKMNKEEFERNKQY